MSELELIERSPFGTPLDDAWQGLHVAERAARTHASVAARRGASRELRERVHTQFGLALPEPGRWCGDDRLAFFWCGHEQWFVDADCNVFPGLAAQLTSSLEDQCAITDQGHAWTSLSVHGEHARAVLERLCPVDLHSDAFGPGSVARTMMEHVRTQIALLDDAPTFAVLTPSSTARSFRAAFHRAAATVCSPP